VPAEFALGNSTTRKVISALQASLPSWRISALVRAKPEPSWLIAAVTSSVSPGFTKARSFACVKAARNGMRENP